jgi:hypothetical protein
MESVSFVGIDIKVIAWDDDHARAVAEDWLQVPPAVDAHNVEHYVVGRFGEPVDVAMARTDGFGELVMGWVFPSSGLDGVELPSDGLVMMVVPFVRFPDGTRRELFEYTAELNSEFAALVTSIDPGAEVLGGPTPVETGGRLETEQLRLFGAQREDVELQVAGWLRRMLADGWTYLILEVAGTGRYVQFLTHEGSWLRGEAVGDRYLEGHDPLSPDERRRLVDLGWNPPGDDPDECGNFWVDWGHDDADPHRFGSVDDVTDGDIEEAARFAAATLCEVFGPVGVDQVDVMAGPASTDEV